MSGTWKTKYGTRRVRHDPPTLQEAIDAARGLTDELEEQVEFAASLMGMPLDEVRAEVLRTAPNPNKAPAATIAFTGRAGAQRTVIVERKPTRRIAAVRTASA
jgi:hypothetical protein